MLADVVVCGFKAERPGASDEFVEFQAIPDVPPSAFCLVSIVEFVKLFELLPKTNAWVGSLGSKIAEGVFNRDQVLLIVSVGSKTALF